MPRNWSEPKKCAQCGKRFEAFHMRARYCSSSCRQLAYRGRKAKMKAVRGA